MAKVSPSSLNRRPRVMLDEKYSTFTSEDGKVVIPMVGGLRRLSPPEFLIAQDLKTQKVEEYLTGKGVEGKPGYEPPAMLPPIGDEPVYVSLTTAEVAACICRAQCAPPDERYTWEEIVSFMIDPAILAQMSETYSMLPMEPIKDPKADLD